MNRLFIGLPIDRGIIENFNPLLEKLSSYKKHLRPVSQAQMHITIKFLGTADLETTSEIIRILPEAIKKHTPISYSAVGFGAFPSLPRAAVLWCGLKTDIHALRSLHKDIERAMEPAGFAKDTRSFRPHITLARIQKGSKLPPPILHYLQENSRASFGSSVFDRVILYKSDLTPEGPHYTELLTIRLTQ